MNTKIYLKDGIPSINPEDIGLLKNFQIIDVRTEEEYTGELGHIKGSRLITLGPDLDFYLKQNDKDQRIIFVCRSGARSGKATLSALAAGFQSVLNLDGGMIKWNALALPISR